MASAALSVHVPCSLLLQRPGAAGTGELPNSCWDSQESSQQRRASKSTGIDWADVAAILMGAGADPISLMGGGADLISEKIAGFL